MDNSIQHGSSPQLPDPSDLNDQYGPNFLSAEARAEQHLDAVESMFIASSAGMDPDEVSDLRARAPRPHVVLRRARRVFNMEQLASEVSGRQVPRRRRPGRCPAG